VSNPFPYVREGAYKDEYDSESELIDLVYPVGTVATVNAPLAAALSGATMPEVGAGGGSFLAYDKASTEAAVFCLGSFVPLTWRSVDLYLETFSFTGGTGDVRWSVNVNSAGEVVTSQAVTADIVQTIFKVSGGPYDLNSNTVAGVAKYGATVVVSRIGGNAADTYDADINLSSLHAVRVS
jgi:hypothetical protein